MGGRSLASPLRQNPAQAEFERGTLCGVLRLPGGIGARRVLLASSQASEVWDGNATVVDQEGRGRGWPRFLLGDLVPSSLPSFTVASAPLW